MPDMHEFMQGLLGRKQKPLENTEDREEKKKEAHQLTKFRYFIED